MRIPTSLLLLPTWFVALLPLASGEEAGSSGQSGVVVRPLDTTQVVKIPVHPARTLTVVFPEAIVDLHGALFTTAPHEIAGSIYLAHHPGERFFSVVPLEERIPSANLNVILDQGRVIVLEPYPVRNPLQAWRSLRFIDPAALSAEETEELRLAELDEVARFRVERTEAAPSQHFLPVTPARLLGFMDACKLLAQCLAERPRLEGLLRAMPHLAISIRRGETTTYPNFRVQLNLVVRHENLDALCFLVRVENTSPHDLCFDSGSFAVRAGLQVYQQTTYDFDPHIPAGESRLGLFIIVGTADGGRNYLHPNGDFRVLLRTLPRAENLLTAGGLP